MRSPWVWRSSHECQLAAALLRVQKIEDDYRQRLAELEARHTVQLAQAEDKAAALAGRVTALRELLKEAQSSGVDTGRARMTAARLERNRQAAARGRAAAADAQDGGMT